MLIDVRWHIHARLESYRQGGHYEYRHVVGDADATPMDNKTKVELVLADSGPMKPVIQFCRPMRLCTGMRVDMHNFITTCVSHVCRHGYRHACRHAATRADVEPI